MDIHEHWETLYASTPADRLGWYRPHLDTSLKLIESLSLPADTPIIDVGCGASTLADDLTSRGFRTITLLDISPIALRIVRHRLGAAAQYCRFLAADVLRAEFSRGEFMLWHDRAVFHFLTLPEDRVRYAAQVSHALRPHGYLIVGAFSHEAPPRCSGLPVQRYNELELHQVFGNNFTLLQHCRELHVTPGGTNQNYVYALFQKAHTAMNDGPIR